MTSIKPTRLRIRRQGRWLLAVLILFAGLAPASAREPEIENLRVERIGDHFVASFQVTGAFTDDVEERIASGLETSFRHRVRVLLRRGGLPDKTLQEEELTTTVKYDALNRQYVLSRLLNGTLRESGFTGDADEMRRWMTEVGEIPVGAAADFDDPSRIYVRVKSNVRWRFLLFFIPVRWNTEWVSLPFPGPPDPHE